MCVFCPASYCDQHADGNIKTRSFVISNCRVRHRVCKSHKTMPCNVDKAGKKSEVRCSAKRSGEAGREIAQADVSIAGSSSVARETTAACGVKEPTTEESFSLQAVSSLDVGVKVATTPAELVESIAEPGDEVDPGNTSSKRTPSRRRSRVEPAASSERKSLAAQLCKKNGIVVETGNLSSSAVEQDYAIQNEKPGSAVKNPGKYHRAPAVNGFRSLVSVTTRQHRSSPRENSQKLNSAANTLETAVDVTTVETVTAPRDELSDSKEPGIVNAEDMVIDDN